MALITSHPLGDIMILRLYMAVMACVLLAGCSVNFQPYTRGPSADSIEDFADEMADERPELQAFRLAITEAALAGDIDAITALMHPDLSASVSPEQLTPLRDLVLAVPITRVDMITYRWHQQVRVDQPDQTTLWLEYILVRDGAPLLHLNIAAEQTGEGQPYLFRTFRWQEFEVAYWEDPEELTRLHYVMIALAILSPFLILQSLIKILTTPRLAGRWAWLLAIFLTIPTIQFVWSTGAFQVLAPSLNGDGGNYTFQIIRFILTGTEISKGGDYHSWVITTGFPLGALLFHIRWFTGQLKRKDDDALRMEGAADTDARV